MAEKKLSPRQKMIGMMYLVLTALLALNVSKEILEAFVLVEKSLARTTGNFDEKNQSVYTDFDAAAAQLERAKPWRDKAYQVKKSADALYTLIDNLKQEIVAAADGPEFDMNDIRSKDNRDIPSEIMIFNKKAGVLRGEIEKYRDMLAGLIKPGDEVLRNALLDNLATDDPEPHPDKGTLTWEKERFEDMPLVAAITLLSKMQNDVRNAEFDVINYLKKEINTETIPFNKVAGTVIAPSNYIVQGDSFRADIFLAAFDTSQSPLIYVGDYDTVSPGVYRMKGDYDSVPVLGGMGKYIVPGSSEGIVDWGGIIQLKTEEGNKQFPFTHTFQVAKPNMVVSATKMNVLYVGLDNPVAISVPGIPADKITPRGSNCTLKRRPDGLYDVRVRGGREASITVMAESSEGQRNMGTMKFRVKQIPAPVAMVADKKGGTIRKAVIRRQRYLAAVLEDFLYENVRYMITSFTMIVFPANGTTRMERSNSHEFKGDIKAMVKQLSAGDRVVFENIKARGPGGSRVVPSLSLKVVN